MAVERIFGQRPSRRVLLGSLGLALLGTSGCGFFVAPASYRIDLTTDPNPPNSGVLTRLRVRVADDAGAAVGGARVSLRGEHLGMSMGGVTIDARETQPGQYAAEANLGMSGRWKVTVTADGAAGRAQREYELQVIPGR